VYVIGKSVKADPVRRWSLPDRVFFAAGACHILTYAFMERYPDAGFNPIWIKPAKGYCGNHIVAARDDLAFDYHGYSHWPALLALAGSTGPHADQGGPLVARLVLYVGRASPRRPRLGAEVAQLRRPLAARARAVPARRPAPRPLFSRPIS
jgi:hypothetical protein